MNNIDYKQEEKRTKRFVLLGSSIVVLVVSLLVAYILISFEIKEFKTHIKTFKDTLIEREKSAIKSAVNNLINDIKYDEISRYQEIKKRLKNQTNIFVNNLEYSVLNQNTGKKDMIKKITYLLEVAYKQSGVAFFMFKNDGELLFSTAKNLKLHQNYIDLKDIDGKQFVKEIINKSGFVDFLWFVPKNLRISKKITFSKKIENLGVVIGSEEFLNTKYPLNQKMVDKIYNEKFNKNNFIFIYEIMSLSSSKNYSKLILEQNIKTTKNDLRAIEDILEKSEYKGNIFYEYNNKLVYSAFLFDQKTFISAGVYLSNIKNILENEEKISHENLIKKISSLLINITIVLVVFFLISYFIAQKIEKLFNDYNNKIINSQQLLIQKTKMASMGEMIANIAHQWRQPLSRLSSFFLDIESAYKFNELDEKYLSKRINQANDVL
ncbi:cache domain-containing protein [Sulfurospirillum sp. 1307]